MVLKLSFKPDLPVAAFLRPSAILMKGSRDKAPVRRGNRRSSASQAEAEDAMSAADTENAVMSLPDTEGHLTD